MMNKSPLLVLLVLVLVIVSVSGSSCIQCDKHCCSLDIQLYKRLPVAVNCSQPDHAVIVVDTETTTGATNHRDDPTFNETSLIYERGCLTDLPVNICNFSSIRAISLRYNNLTTFPRLTCLHRLLVLDLTGNSITQVPEGAFHGLPQLREVYLDGNVITSIHPDAFDNEVTCLQIFTIANNLLTVVNPWLFLLPYKFCRFEFQHNHLAHFVNEHQRNINFTSHYGPGLVNFSYNDVTYSPVKELMKLGIKNIDEMSKFRWWGFDFRHNPFHCDCEMYQVIVIVDSMTALFNIDYLNVTCGSPPKFKDVFFNKLPLDELVCNITENCPSSCTCTKRPYYQDVLVNCTHVWLTMLPDDMPEGNLTLEMIGNTIEFLHVPGYLERVVHLNLSANHLREIHPLAAMALRNVRSLDLRGNNLQHLPTTLNVLSPDALYLDTNTLQCTCDLEWFPRWANHHDRNNIHEVMCLSGVDGRHVLLINATREDLGCDAGNTSLVHVAWTYVILVAALIVAPILVVVFRYEVLVLKHHFFHRERKKKHFPALLDASRYDVFVSTASDSDKDATWVSRILLPAMERRRLTYFLPQRDYLPGAIPMDEVVQTLRQSKCALILLSPDYLAQPICCFQFRQAYNMMVKEGRGRVFVLCLQKVKRGQLQDRFLQAMLNLNMAYLGHRPEHLDAVLDRMYAYTQ